MIRPLTEADIPFIAKLEKLCFSAPWSEQSIRESFACDNNHFFVKEAEGKPVGYIGLSVAADEGYIYNVAVLPEYRGQGIGRELVLYILNAFRKLAFVTLEVRPSNNAAIGLYTKLGFEKVGERRNYYRNPTENALLLTKFLR